MSAVEALPTLNPALAALFQRLLDEMDRREKHEWDATESVIDPAVYHDPAILAREIAQVFRQFPLCLGHADQLREPGAMLARDLFGLPLLVARNRDGAINVLLNVCRHRGARLVEGEHAVCRKAALTCPYHAWTYDLDGRLRSVPGADGFPHLDHASRSLRRLPSAVRHGLIWACLDPAAAEPDIAGFLGGLDDDLGALGLGTHRFFRQHARTRRLNWKLMMDAFQEDYHIKSLHRQTIAPFFLDMQTIGEAVGLHARLLVGRDRLPDARRLPRAAWDVRRHVTLTHMIFPNNLLIYHPDSTSHLAMFPIAVDEMLFVHTLFTPHAPRNDQEQAHWERNFAMIDEGVFGAEDLHMSEQIQLGVKSGANDTFLLGRFEQHIRRFHDNLNAILKP